MLEQRKNERATKPTPNIQATNNRTAIKNNATKPRPRK
jgi:hypothetical protein